MDKNINGLKDSSKKLIFSMSFLVLLITVCYLGSSNTQVTYSATTCEVTYSSCSPSAKNSKCSSLGGTLNGSTCTYSLTSGSCGASTATCTAANEKCYSSQAQCQSATGYECSQFYSGCGYVQSGNKLGTGVSCVTGNTSGTCGSRTVTVCGIYSSWSCNNGNVTYSYTCTHDSGSQTGADGSYSTCTLEGSTTNNKACSAVISGKCGDATFVSTSASYTSCKASDGNTYTYTRSMVGKCDETEDGVKNEYSYYKYTKVVSSSSSSPSSSSSKPSSPASPSDTVRPSSALPSSNVPSSVSSSSNQTITNPQTGSIAIFMAWVVALVAIGYSFYYYKVSSKIN